MHVCVRKKGERSSDSHCVPVRLRKSSKEGDLKVIGTLDAYLGLKGGFRDLQLQLGALLSSCDSSNNAVTAPGSCIKREEAWTLGVPDVGLVDWGSLPGAQPRTKPHTLPILNSQEEKFWIYLFIPPIHPPLSPSCSFLCTC